MQELKISAKDTVVIHFIKDLDLDNPFEARLCFGAMKASVDLSQSLL